MDSAGDAYVTGAAESSDFPTTPGAYQTTYGGGEDAFVTKLNPTGSALVYSTYLGSSGNNVGYAIALDTAGDAYVTGVTGSTDFPATPGASQTTYGGGQGDAFVSKLNPTGTALVYSTYLGGTALDTGTGIAVDTAGGAYVTGYTDSTDFPTTSGAAQADCDGGEDSLAAKFSFEVQTTVNTLADDPGGPIPGYTTLRDAITQANADTADQYVITFSVTGAIDLTSALPALDNNIEIDGPGALDLTVQRDFYTPTFSVFVVDSGVTVGLSGLSIAGGNSISGDGGGLDNFGTVTVTGVIFTGNSANNGYGGGVFNESGGTLSVIGSAFTGNSATSGGGLYNDGAATVTDSAFNCNAANNGYGGGLFNANGRTVTLVGTSFNGNSAAYGGGINNNDGGILTVAGSSFTGNSADDSGGLLNDGAAMVTDSSFTKNIATIYGGGIFNNIGTATVIGSTFTGNTAFSAGGAIFDAEGATVAVIGSTLVGNSAIYLGGGGIYYDYDTTVTVVDSTITNDSAGVGGGIDGFGSLTVTNCTVSGNSSQRAGGGIASYYGSLTLDNTIVAGNTGAGENDIFGLVQPTSAFNLIGDGSGISNLTTIEVPALSNLVGTTAEPLNPLLAPLGDYGGPSETMALLPGSPAIDAGSNALSVDASGNPLTTDQRGVGFPRVVNGTVDIGAFESQGFTLTPVTGSTPQTTPVNSPFVNPLAVIVTANNLLEPVAGGAVTFSRLRAVPP